MFVQSQQRKLSLPCDIVLQQSFEFVFRLLSCTLPRFPSQKCLPLPVPLGSPQYTAGLECHPVKSCTLLVPYQEGIKIWCICSVSSSFLRTCERSSCAADLARPLAFHSTAVLLDLHFGAHIRFLGISVRQILTRSSH